MQGEYVIRFLRYYLLAAAILMAICYSYYDLSRDDLIYRAELVDASLTRQAQQILSNEFRQFGSDLMVFSHMKEWDDGFDEPDGKGFDDLTSEFQALLSAKRDYARVSLLGLDGREMLRVDYHNGSPKAVAASALQNKSHRYYVTEAMQLQRHQIYISRLDLNRVKEDATEQPQMPTIRLITPVFDGQGNKRGLLVFNVLVEAMMQRFMGHHKEFAHRSLLLTGDGNWMHVPGDVKTWRLPLSDQQKERFRDTFPEAWEYIYKHEKGQFRNDQGVFTFATIRPVQAASRALPDRLKQLRPGNRHITQPTWKVVEYRNMADLAAIAAPAGWRIAGYSLLFLLLLAALVWRVVSNAINRDRAEQQQRDGERKFRDLIEGFPDGVAVFVNAKIEYANPAAIKLFCRENSPSILGRPIMDFVHEDSRSLVLRRMQAVMQGESVQTIEEHLLATDGSDVFALVSSARLEFEGKPAMQSVIRDISEQHRIEESLHQKEEDYRQLYSMLRMMCDNMPDMMWAKDLNQRYIFANKALCENLLHAEDTGEPEGKLDMFFAQRERDLRPADSQWHTFGEICRDSDAITLESGKIGQFDEFGNIRGKFLFLDVHKAPMLDASGEVVGVVGSARDVTEARQAEEQLRKLSRAIDHAGESILITDASAIIEYVNPAFSRITGYDADEVVGQTPALLNSRRQDENFYQSFWKKISSGEVWQGSLVDRRKDGSLYPALMSVAPIFDEQDNITHYVAIQQDMSAHEELEEKFRQAQKMEALGTLVGGIAHDFNNVLAGMLGNLYLAKQQTASNASVQTKLARVERAGLHAAEMIKQLLAFARREESKLTPMPVQPFIKEILRLARSSIPENIALQHELGEQDYCIRGDGSQLQQILLNLLVNASHALDGREKPAITVSMRIFEPDTVFLMAHPISNNRLLLSISVADNGCGINKANLERVFEPFFTTKEVGKGTGLGLAMVYGSMQTHGGAIDIESDEGKGTRVNLYFPVCDAKEPADKKEGVDIIRGKGETILLADDNIHVRETMQEILENFGYRVLAVENGREAVQSFTGHPSKIDLVLLDIVMPVMGGVEAAKRLRELNPDLPILLLSGYEQGSPARNKIAMEDIIVLAKPVDLPALSLHIREAINC